MRKILLLSVIFLASCCGIPQKAVLELPPKVSCTKPSDKELKPVSDKTYEKIVNLYLDCVGNDETLRNIIRATHN